MALVITDNTSYVTFESSATNEQRYHIPKNAIALNRNGVNFRLNNGDDSELVKFAFVDVTSVDAVAPADADALETALLGVLFQ